MNNYSIECDRKNTVIIIFLISLFFTYILNFVCGGIINSIVFMLEQNFNDLYNFLNDFDFIFSKIDYMIIFGLLWIFFDSYLWKIGWFASILKCKIPDISGKWSGILVSTYKSDNNGENATTEMNMIMEVKQTYSTLNVVCYFYKLNKDEINSISRSKLIGLFNENGEIRLKFSYKNDSTELSSNSTKYSGYNEFTIDLEKSEMYGYYFTGRETGQNRGTMMLKKI